MDNTPENNPLSDAGATLGRVLFYDRQLSSNNTIACGSCHQQRRAFSDPQQFSLGFDGGRTGRNAMGLVNLCENVKEPPHLFIALGGLARGQALDERTA